MLNRRALAIALIASLLTLPILAQSQSDKDLLEGIRKQERDNSQLMKTEHMLTDVYGPRLTGSPNHKAAAEWAIRQMTAWGLSNAHLEAWDFGHVGWLNERFTGHIISPVKDVLSCEVLSWTPGTRGPVTAKSYQLILPDRPSQEQLTTYFETQKAKVRGRIVMAGKHIVVPVNFNPPANGLYVYQFSPVISSISPFSVSLPAAGGTGTVSFRLGAGCNMWTATSLPPTARSITRCSSRTTSR